MKKAATFLNYKKTTAWAKENGVNVYEYCIWLRNTHKGKPYVQINTQENRDQFIKNSRRQS